MGKTKEKIDQLWYMMTNHLTMTETVKDRLFSVLMVIGLILVVAFGIVWLLFLGILWGIGAILEVIFTLSLVYLIIWIFTGKYYFGWSEDLVNRLDGSFTEMRKKKN